MYSTDKMYAVVLNKQVVGPAVLSKDELSNLEKENPDYTFVEMTKENSPAAVGCFWNGKNFYYGEES